MTVKEQITALIATFSRRKEAERFVDELKRAGFKDDEIGVVSPHQDEEAGPVEEGALAGAITGGAIGAFAGAAATGLIPGIGPLIAGGLLAGMAGGVAAGATAGGVVGALIGLGVPEDEAHKYQEEFLAGRTLVVVQALGRGGDALSILNRVKSPLERAWHRDD